MGEEDLSIAVFAPQTESERDQRQPAEPTQAIADWDRSVAVTAAHLHRWTQIVWNRQILALSEASDVSFQELLVSSEDVRNLFPAIARDTQSARSVEDIVSAAKMIFVRFLLERDIDDWKDNLEAMIESREGAEALAQLSGSQSFYFWLCEARESISGRPVLPLAIGRVFDHSEEMVRDYLQASHRKIRGDSQVVGAQDRRREGAETRTDLILIARQPWSKWSSITPTEADLRAVS